MKITDVKAVYPKYIHTPSSWRSSLWQIVVKIETNVGIFGYGFGGGGLASVAIVNNHFKELLIGKNIDSKDDISEIWDHLYFESIPYGRKGIAIMALSGVDLALWDLLGKAEGTPVYNLVGTRNKQSVQSYATGTDIEWYAELGFTAHKFPHRWRNDLDYDTAVLSAERSRTLVGKNGKVMIDTYMSWDTEVTTRMSEQLKDFDIYWFEDVLEPDKLQAQSLLRPDVKPTLIAGGEHEFTHHGFQAIADNKALDLWQPDITWCGGITAALKIMQIAKHEKIPVVPHRGGEVWGLHFIVSSDCENLAEILPGTREETKDELWLGEPEYFEGYTEPTDRPGFGVAPNFSMLP